MNEYPVSITNLNDFIFCPVSIYFHNLDIDTDKMQYQDEVQINGTAKHKNPDNAVYSTRKDILQGMSVYSEKYGLYGKIDLYNERKGILIERKKKIKTIYDGYIFQVYAQYFALQEMGYHANKIHLYSMDDNKTYNVLKPHEDNEKFIAFVKVIEDIKSFSLENFVQSNKLKCKHCIYEPLCSYSKEKE